MSSYTALTADIQSWIENASAELVAACPTIITNTELRLSRDLIVYGFRTSKTGNFVTGTNTIARPYDLLFPDTLYYINGSNKKVVLQWNQLENILVQFDDASAAGYAPPASYGLNDSSTFIIGPTPDSAYAWTLIYHGNAVGANWYTQYAYDALLAGCLEEAARFVLDDRQASLIAIWGSKYKELVAAINALDVRANRDQSRAPALQQTISA